MGLKFVIGGAGSGKTEYIKKQIKELNEKFPDKKILYIVPEQFTLNAEYIITELLGGAMINTDVVSFKRLAYNVFSEVGISDLPVLDSVEKNIVLRKVISELHENNELVFFDKVTSRSGFIERISSTVSEFVHYMIDDEKLDILIEDAIERTNENNASVLKYQDLKLIYNKYNEFISDKYISAEKTPDYLAELIEKSDKLKGAEVFIDSFSGFSPQEIAVVKALLHKCGNVTIAMCVTEINDDKNEFYCEPMGAVRNILKLCAIENIPVEKEYNCGKKNKRQSGILGEFSENYLEFSDKVCKTENNGEIEVVCADNMYSEIRFAANEICTLARENNVLYSEMAVILGDKSYLPAVKNIFRKFNIVYFDDNKTNALAHPLAQLVINFLKMYIYNFKYEDVFNMLKTGFFEDIESFGWDNIYEMENYVLEYNKNGEKQYKTEWLGKKAYKNTEAVRRVFEKMFISDNSVKLGNRSYIVLNISKKIRKLFERLNVEATLEKWCENESEYINRDIHKQVLEAVLGTIDKIDSVLGKTKITVNEYCVIFTDALKSTSIGFIPSRLDELAVGDMDRSRFSDIKYLFILGANDGYVPPKVFDLGFISDEEREAARYRGVDLAADSSHIIRHNEFLIYTALSIPSERIYVCRSYSSITGNTKMPSMLVKRILAQCSGVKEKNVTKDNNYIVSKSTAVETFFEKMKSGSHLPVVQALYEIIKNEYPEFEDKLKTAIYKLRQRDNLKKGVTDEFMNRKFSVTQIETFNLCHFRYFANYILGLKPRGKGEIDRSVVGEVNHGILQRVFEIVRKKEEDGSFKLSDAAEDIDKLQKDINEFMEKAVEEYKNSEEYKYSGFDISGENKHIFERIEKITAITASAVALNLAETGFELYETEMEFRNDKAFKIELDNGRNVMFGGKIDRIDTYKGEDGKTYVRIVDYKPSEKALNRTDIELGIQLQLITYLDAFLKMKQKDGEMGDVSAAGAFFMRVGENVIDEPDAESSIADDVREMYEKYKLNGIISVNEDIANAMSNTRSKKCIEADEDEFEQYFEIVEKSIKNACEEIINGNIKISPVADSSKKEACRYCEYYPLCSKDFMEESEI